jgi:hypothetical protein
MNALLSLDINSYRRREVSRGSGDRTAGAVASATAICPPAEIDDHKHRNLRVE